jgi:hypothetical protein
MPAPGGEASNGLGELAHAVRRSMALHCAIITSTEDTADDELFLRADRYAEWIRGHASRPLGSAPLGKSLHDVN